MAFLRTIGGFLRWVGRQKISGLPITSEVRPKNCASTRLSSISGTLRLAARRSIASGCAAINLFVDEAMWCEGAFYSTIDAMFARTKGDILGRLVGLLKNRGFSDDVIGPKSPLVAKLKTEIGLRITHMKKEHVTHPGTV